jgi:hypothetical protein
VDLVLFGGAHRSETVYLVEEDNRRLQLACTIEQHAQLALGLTHPLGETVRTLAHEEAHLLLALA